MPSPHADFFEWENTPSHYNQMSALNKFIEEGNGMGAWLGRLELTEPLPKHEIRHTDCTINPINT